MIGAIIYRNRSMVSAQEEKVESKTQIVQERKNRIDSIKNPKLRERVNSIEYNLNSWDDFAKHFYEGYPDFSNGYVKYLMARYKFNEDLSYKIAELNYNNIKSRFKDPLDFILYDDKNNFRNDKSFLAYDTASILQIMTRNQWLEKIEIDEIISQFYIDVAAEEMATMNSGDSALRLPLISWEYGGIEYLLNGLAGGGMIKLYSSANGWNNNDAVKFCDCRIEYFKKHFKRPIDYVSFWDKLSNESLKYTDKGNKMNANECAEKAGVRFSQ